MDSEFNNNQNQNNTVSNGIAIAGMVLGIISIVLCWIPFVPVVLGIVGLILGVKGMRKSNTLPQNKGKGMGITGIICGSMGTLVSVIYTIVWIMIIVVAKMDYDEASNNYNSYKNEYNSYKRYTNYSQVSTQEIAMNTILDDYTY